MTVTQPPQLESLGDRRSPGATRPRWARVMGSTGRFLITAGVVVALFAAYQVWGTGIHEARAQSSLRSDFDARLELARSRLADLVAQPDADDVVSTDPAPTAPAGPDDSDENAPGPDDTPASVDATVDPEVLALLFPEIGDAVARLEIPALGLEKVVVRGTHTADLRKGPGLYPSSVLPGESGNAAIAGHRTTYGAPFNQIDELVPGDEIVVTTTQGRFSYRVSDPMVALAARSDAVADFGPGHAVVAPSASWVLDDFGDDRLTLTACHPRLSARQRIVVVAELVSAPVALPDAIAATVAALRQGGLTEEALLTAPRDEDQAEVTSAVGGSGASSFDLSDLGAPADLDEGLGGERGAIPVAAAWLLLAAAIWIGAGRVARGGNGWTRRLGPYAAAAAPVAAALWMCFEAADRALPAY